MTRVATVAEVPGYLAARRAETVGRDIACLCQRGNVLGLPVGPITLRIYGELRLARSPLLRGCEWKDVEVVDLIQFLRQLNPNLPRHESRKRARFENRCLKLFAQPARRFWQTERRHAKLCARALVRRAIATKQALAYAADALMDAPGGGGSGNDVEPYSDIVAIICLMGNQFGWSMEATLDTPLKVIFQAMRVARLNDWVACRLAGSQAPKPVFLSRSDDVIERYLREVNRNERN